MTAIEPQEGPVGISRLTIVASSRFDARALARKVHRLSRGSRLTVRLCTTRSTASADVRRLLERLRALQIPVSTHLSVRTDDVLTMPADLAMAIRDDEASEIVRELSRRLVAPLWVLSRAPTDPVSVVAVIDPDMATDFDPAMARAILLTTHCLGTALDLPMDVINVWDFLEEGLLRSWRSEMPVQEIDQMKQAAEWASQIGFNRLAPTLPRDLNWKRFSSVRGPIGRKFEATAPGDVLLVTGTHGRDGWAARLRSNLAERLSAIPGAGTVIVHSPDYPENARLTRCLLKKLSAG